MSKPFLTIDWHITQQCDQRCRHCYAASEHFQGEIGHSEAIRIIHKILNLKNDFNIRVTLTGGEPLLMADVFQIASLLSKNDIPISLTTNGILVGKNIDKIVRSGISYIQISIDGTRQVHDYLRGSNTFEAAADAIRLLNTEDVMLSVMTTVGSYNFNQVPEIIDTVRNLGIPLLGIQRFVPSGRGADFKNFALTPARTRELMEYIAGKKDELKEEICIVTSDPLRLLVDRQETAGCMLGRNILVLTPKGDMLPCCKLPINLGNLLTMDFYEAWHSGILDTVRNSDNLKGKCRGCKYRHSCRGCRAAAYAAYGDYLAQDPQCWLD